MDNFYKILNNLKFTPRKGWLERKLDSDTIGSHIFSAMSLGWLIAQKEDANRNKVTELLLVHDWVMGKMDDVTPDSGKYIEKESLEEIAKIAVAKELPEDLAKDYLELFDEFQKQESLESLIAREADKLETLLQGEKYEELSNRSDILDQFLETYQNIFKTKTAKELYHLIQTRHQLRKVKPLQKIAK